MLLNCIRWSPGRERSQSPSKDAHIKMERKSSSGYENWSETAKHVNDFKSSNLQFGIGVPPAKSSSSHKGGSDTGNQVSYVMKGGFKMPKKHLSDLSSSLDNMQVLPSVQQGTTNGSLKDRKQLVRPGTAPAQRRP